jgi:hypothetical protein
MKQHTAWPWCSPTLDTKQVPINFFFKFGFVGRVTNTTSLPSNLIFRKFIPQKDTEAF